MRAVTLKKMFNWLFAPIAITSAAVLLPSCGRGGPVALTTESPKHTYVVDVSGRFSRPSIPFLIEHVITFVARRGGVLIATGRLFEGDRMDGGFADNYNQHDWQAENVLRFGAANRQDSKVVDQITITSRSSSRIAFITVHYCDLFLALDLHPGAAVRFSAPRDPTAFISVEAKIDGTKEPRYEGHHFDVDAGREALKPIEINIEIGSRDIKIERQASSAPITKLSESTQSGRIIDAVAAQAPSECTADQERALDQVRMAATLERMPVFASDHCGVRSSATLPQAEVIRAFSKTV